MNKEPEVLFFESQSDFRKWLSKNHKLSNELYVGYYKVDSGRPGMTWSQSVDQALCFGWIDGVRKSIDKDRYYIRFSPRKPKSIWSNVNIKKAEELLESGLMKPSGIAAFNLREESKTGIYSYEVETAKFSSEFEQLFRANKKAWTFFISMAPSYRKPATRWVMSAKQESTRARRLNELIRDSENGRKIKQLSY
jgi:uncharacterized protein YdeI (YjbR/CyaY-like superfamily)